MVMCRWIRTLRVLTILANKPPASSSHQKFLTSTTSLRKVYKGSRKRAKKFGDILTNEVLYGRSVCNIALRASRRAIFRLHLLAHWENTEPTDSRVIETIGLARERGIPISYLPRGNLDEMSLQRPHQGVCLEVGELPFKSMDETDIQEMDSKFPPLWVLLHGLLDPMNVGAVLRSCLYFDVDRVIVHGSCSPLTPTVSKASSGAAEILPVYRTENAKKLIKSLQKDNWDVIGTSSHPPQDGPINMNIEDVRQATLLNKSLLIFGSEGPGVPDDMLRVCNRIVTIPEIMNDDGSVLLRHLVGSLNVSTAAAIILYELQQMRLQE